MSITSKMMHGAGAAGEFKGDWLLALRRYFLVVSLGNLMWEFLHLPLYTLWYTDSAEQVAFAALHCTGGDLLIAAATLLASLLVLGKGWPTGPHAFRRVAVSTMGLGIAYTIFSEWLNVTVRQSWGYSDLMPVVPPFGTGLSPLLQWVVIPAAAFWYARRGIMQAATTRCCRAGHT